MPLDRSGVSPPAASDPPARPASAERVGGLDALRTLAVALVFVHHAWSLAGFDPYVHALGFPVGRVGTALFVALAGSLAAISTAPSPAEWLWRRLCRIYPAYWLVMLVVLVGVAWSGYKPIGPAQFISQMLGLGLFTHPDRLVHVATWFVSLILLLYCLTALAKRLGPDREIAAALAAGCAAVPLLGVDVGYSAHASTYFAAYLAFRAPPSRRGVWLAAVTVAMALAAIYVWPVWSCGAIAVGLIGAAVAAPIDAPVFRQASRYSYEFYLTNGPVLAALFAAAPRRPVLVSLIALLASAALAVALHRATIGFSAPRRQAAPAIA
ncbi:acyltransferase [Botrimarina sp.]|uniref:acyltransferase family protein n=1 Tax=Botrimarina sp. TaxID=2795802 RepID=UPI0032F07484